MPRTSPSVSSRGRTQVFFKATTVASDPPELTAKEAAAFRGFSTPVYTLPQTDFANFLDQIGTNTFFNVPVVVGFTDWSVIEAALRQQLQSANMTGDGPATVNTPPGAAFGRGAFWFPDIAKLKNLTNAVIAAGSYWDLDALMGVYAVDGADGVLGLASLS